MILFVRNGNNLNEKDVIICYQHIGNPGSFRKLKKFPALNYFWHFFQ
jgi:hypothetical protein